MKNFIRTLALAMMLIFGLSSFTGVENKQIKNMVVYGCDDYATQTTNYIIMNHHLMYDNEAYAVVWTALYNDCMGQ